MVQCKTSITRKRRRKYRKFCDQIMPIPYLFSCLVIISFVPKTGMLMCLLLLYITLQYEEDTQILKKYYKCTEKNVCFSVAYGLGGVAGVKIF